MLADARSARSSPAIWTFLGWALLLGVGLTSHAATLEVIVTDEAAAPLQDVVVYAMPQEVDGARRSKPRPAVMDQRNRAFVPHVLTVQQGAYVSFPNSDSVSHHVYSFSPVKRFELPLYRGDVHPPLRFDRPGVVVVGCNIHDDMLGYIVVVDTPHHAATDERGVSRLTDMAPGEYRLHVWTSRLPPRSLPSPMPLTLLEGDRARVSVKLPGRLANIPDDSETLMWSEY